MNEAFRVAHERNGKPGQSNKKRYDARNKCVAVEAGDRVLLENVEMGGTGKLQSCWEHKSLMKSSRNKILFSFTHLGAFGMFNLACHPMHSMVMAIKTAQN